MESLIRLLTIDKKRELIKFCSSSQIHSCDFVLLILACESGLLPWKHQISYRDFVPEHLIPTQKDHDGLSRSHVGATHSDGQKAVRKIHQLFVQRRYLVGHIFYTPDHTNWHFFYFDQRDLSTHGNHWQHGPHIHLINHLWPNWNLTSLWNAFHSGNPKLNSAVHIKYLDPARIRPSAN